VAADASPITGAASRYAQALFELALDSQSLDAVAADLETLNRLIAENEDLARLVRSPVFSREEQSSAMDAILTRVGVETLTRNFVLLAAKNRRLFLLPQIVRAFTAALAKHRGEMTAEVTSPYPLSDEQIAQIKDTLKQTYKRDARIDVKIDRSLLAGLIVKVGSRMIDSSLKTKLANLKIAMKGT
jgi:F-type H+-transporting ATPase subunit delta